MEGNVSKLLRINNVTTSTGRCGISCYSDRLYSDAAEEGLEVKAVPLPQWSSNPLVYVRAGLECGNGAKLINVQYALGVFGKILDVPKLRGINYFPVLWLFLMLHRFLGKKVVYTVHEVCPSHPWEKVCLPLLKASGDGFIVLSARVKRDLVKAGVDERRITLVPFPIRKARRISKKRCREALGISQDKLVLLLFGFVSRPKGFDLVLSALPELPDSATVVIAGSPRTSEDRAYLRSLEKSAAALPGRVVFLGYVDEEKVPLVFGSADLAIEPYRSIHNSLVLSDMMSYGLPVLASDLEYFSGISETFGCLETFRAGDRADLARKANLLLGDRGRLSELSCSTGKYRLAAGKALSCAADEFRRLSAEG